MLNDSSFIMSPHNFKVVNIKESYILSYDGEKHCLLENDNVRIMTRVIDARYPDYNAVIPKDSPNIAVLDKTDLIDNLKYAMLTANSTTSQIVLNFTNDSVKMTSKDVDFGKSFESEVQCNSYNGEPLDISFNGLFTDTICKAIESDTLSFAMSTPNRGAVINGEYLLMPVIL